MMWLLLALTSGSCAAILAIVIKMHLKHINSMFVTLLFAMVTIVMLVIADLLTNKVDLRLMINLTGKEWLALIVAGILNSVAVICYVSALQLGKTGGVVAIDRLGIVTAIVLASFFLGEVFTIQSIVGAILMVAGAFLINS